MMIFSKFIYPILKYLGSLTYVFVDKTVSD